MLIANVSLKKLPGFLERLKEARYIINEKRTYQACHTLRWHIEATYFPGKPLQSPETNAYTDESAEVQSPDQSDS